LQIKEVIDAALANTAGLIEAGRFTVECYIAAQLPQVVGDASGLSQCLQNLITNALKYGASPQSDERNARWIGIRASLSDQGSAGKEVKIDVSDRGMGITDADLPHIFEPFYRSPSVRAAQIRGTGLGLSLSRSIAEAMNGRLAVTSAPGRGSTFTVYVPCV
jgi:signal transduction histidine kinase